MYVEKLMSVSNRFIIALDPSGRYVINETASKRYIYDLIKQENKELTKKAMINVLWYKNYLFFLTESMITYRLDINTNEIIKYKRYNCEIFSSNLIQTKFYVIRYDSFTHNILRYSKIEDDAKVIELPLKDNQRILGMTPFKEDACLVNIINDNDFPTEMEPDFDLKLFDVNNLQFKVIEINDYLKNEVCNSVLFEMIYFENIHIWYFKMENKSFFMNEDLQEILYEFNEDEYGIEIQLGLFQYIEEINCLLFEVKKENQYIIVCLNLITYTYKKIFQMDDYSPFLYSYQLSKLVIGNSYKLRGGFEIYELKL